jgi:hypothetical protein
MPNRMPDNVIKIFSATRAPSSPVHEVNQSLKGKSSSNTIRHLASAFSVALWMSVKLVWPLAQWIVSGDVMFHLALAIYHWDNPNHYDGWIFLGHLTAGIALTWFATIYRPLQS